MTDLTQQPSGPPDYVSVLFEQAAKGNIPGFIERRAGQDLGLAEGGVGGIYESALGTLGGMGKGVVDSTLGLGRGLYWLGTAGQGDSSWIPESMYDLLPTDYATKLSSRIAQSKLGATGETTGQILSLLGGNIGGIAGKTAGLTEKGLRAVGVGEKALKAGEAVAKAGSLPGKVLGKLEWPGKVLGRKLVEKVPGLSQYTRLSKALPEVMGSASGFGLYGLLTTGDVNADGTTDMDDRIAAGLHGLMAGAALRVIGMGADKLEGKLLDMTLKPSAKSFYTESYIKLRQAEGVTWQQFSDMLGPRAVSTLAEAAGWSLLDRRFTDAMLSGDYEKAMELYTQSIPGALLARTGRTDYWESYRRTNPEMNTAGLRMDALTVRRGRDGQEPQAPRLQDPPQPPKQIGNTDTVYAGEQRSVQAGMQAPGIAYGFPDVVPGQGSTSQGPASGRPDSPALDALSKPLLDAGWDIPQGVPELGTLQLELAGGGSITIAETGQVSVPRALFKQIRGDDAEVARSAELDTASKWATYLISKSYPQGEAGSMEQMAKQQITMDIDVDQARALLAHAPSGSIMQKALKDIVEADAPYGPVTMSGLEVARAVASWKKQAAGASPNSKRVNDWLNAAAEETHRWALVDQYGEGSLAGQLAKKAPRISLGDYVDKVAGPIYMEGPVAQEFIGDVAAISQMRQMAGEIHLGGREISAGGWFDQGDGTAKKVGLDGKVYTSELPMEPGAKLEGEELVPVPLDLAPQTPELARWLELAKAVRGTAKQTPGVDLIEAAVVTAIAGNPESKSVQELVAFMQANNPDLIAQGLNPETVEHLGDALGRIGSGHATADNVGAFMRPPGWAQAEAQPAPVTDAEPDAISDEIPNEGSNPEAGFVDFGPAVDLAVKGFDKGVEVGRKGVESAGIALDYLTQRRPEIIRKALPEDTITAELQRVNAKRRRHTGESTALFKPAQEVANKKAWRDRMVTLKPNAREVAIPGQGVAGGVKKWSHVDPRLDKVEIARWELVGDKKIAETDQDRMFQDAVQGALRYLWQNKQKVGGWQGTGAAARPLSMRDRQVLPRLRGKDEPTVMADPELRGVWFKVLENQNPGGMTAKEREAEYQSLQAQKMISQDRRSALEYIRDDEIVPHAMTVDGRRYEMRETDPRQVMSTVVRTQSGEIAATGEWGQEGGEAARPALEKAMKDMPDGPLKDAIKRNLELGGIAARQVKVGQALDQIRMGPQRKQFVTELIQDAFVLAQGGSVDEQSLRDRFMRAARSWDSIPRSVMTMRAPALDAPEFVLLPLMFGSRYALKTFKRMVGRNRQMSLGEAIEHYSRLGVISARMAHLLYDKSGGVQGWASGKLGWLGEKTELAKAAEMGIMSDVMLEAFRERGLQPHDIRTMAELRMPADVITRFANKTFTEDDANLFRIEFVANATRRREKGEGVPSSDSATMTFMFRFVRLIGEQMAMLRNKLGDSAKAFSEGDHRKGWTELGTFFQRGTGFAISSLTGVGFFGLLLSSLFRGSFDDTDDRMRDEMMTTEGWLRHMRRAMAGGPLESASQVIVNPSLKSAVESTAPGDMLSAIWDISHSFANGVSTDDAVEALNRMHLIPFGSDVVRRGFPRLKEHAIAAFAGTKLSLKTDYIQDRDDVYRFLRTGAAKETGLLGIEEARSDFVASKSDEFYASVRQGMDEWMRAEAQEAGTGFDAAMGVWEKAINIEDQGGPRSVASWIRSQRAMAKIPRDKQDEFLDFIGPERFGEIMANDRALDALAKVVGRMEGEMPADWEGRLNELREVAQAGGGDYRKFVDEAVEYTARSLRAKARDYSYIDDIAPIIASNRDVFLDVFQSEAAPRVWPKDKDMRVRWARGELIRRAISRMRDKITEDR